MGASRGADEAALELPPGLHAYVQHDRLLVLRADDLDRNVGPWRQHGAALAGIIDTLGYHSAVAQELRNARRGGAVAPITSVPQLRSTGQVLFIWLDCRRAAPPPPPPPPQLPAPGGAPAEHAAAAGAEEHVGALLGGGGAAASVSYLAIGLLKVGRKTLFLMPPMGGGLREVWAQCVLDFFVLERAQRRGVGRELFEAMLEVLDARPEGLCYDRPSPKLLAFLRRHYALANAVPQTNNYCVFAAFFSELPPPRRHEHASINMRPLSARGAPQQQRGPPLRGRPF